MVSDELVARITGLEAKVDSLEKITQLIQGALARIEAIEKAQLDATLAASAWKATAAKAIGSGMARGCESMAAATASARVQVGILGLIAIWLMGHYELVGKFGDYIEIGNGGSHTEEIAPARTEARPAP